MDLMASITEKLVQKLKPGQKAMCDRLAGFGVKRSVKERKIAFFVRRRIGKKDVRRVIGRYPAMSVRQARKKALSALAKLEAAKPTRQLELPLPAEMTELREVKREVRTLDEHFGLGRSQVTFAELVEQVGELFLKDLGPSTKRTYAMYIDAVLLPEWGDKRLNEITSESVHGWTLDYKGPNDGGPAQPLKILKGLMTLARRLGFVRHQIEIPGAYKSKRGEEVDHKDVKRIRKYLRAKIEQEADIRDYAVLLATYTGERSFALVSLHTSEVDFRSGLVTKTRKGSKVEPIPYSRTALELLKQIRPRQGGYFFPNKRSGSDHLTSQTLRRYFQAICERLKITLPSGARPKVHSLRHSFVTEVVNQPGERALKAASTLAGHESTKTTERYAHKDLTVARRFANRLSMD